MKALKRTFIFLLEKVLPILLCVVIITVSIPPKKVEAFAPALPYAGYVIYEVLKSAVILGLVSAGVYDYASDGALTDAVMNDFLSYTKGIDFNNVLPGNTDVSDETRTKILLPGGIGGIDGDYWVKEPNTGEIYNNPTLTDEALVNWIIEHEMNSGGKPQEPPPDDKLKIDKGLFFSASAGLVALVSNFFSSLSSDPSISPALASHLTPEEIAEIGWSGAYERNGDGNISISGTVKEVLDRRDMEYGGTFTYPVYLVRTGTASGVNSSINDNFTIYVNINGSLTTNRTNIAKNELNGIYRMDFWKDTKTLSGPYWGSNTIMLSKSGSAINIPVFNTTTELSLYLQTGNKSLAVNYTPQSPQLDKKALAKNLTAPLSPLAQLVPGTYISTDISRQIANAIKTEMETSPEIDNQTYTQTVTDIVNDVVTQTQIQVQPVIDADTGTQPQPTLPPPPPAVIPATGNDLIDSVTSRGSMAWTTLFPFCIPFDLIYLISVLNAEPEAPRWEIPLYNEDFGIDYTFVIDMEEFESLARIFRILQTISFILGLILITRGQMIKG
ncbi:MAG: hypothetical protein FWG91_05725 [Lachnospiraceae bacterium]|nr:hypothetical protein [Lachnospiraceae bacterium]